MTRTISISDAKSHLSELIGRIMYAGDNIIVERHGKAVAVIIPIEDYQELEKTKSGQPSATQDHHQEVLTGIVSR